MKTKPTLTAERLRELLHYDPETGVFTHLGVKANRTDLLGTVAGWTDRGYIRITLDGVAYRANRLAWLYMTGEWPAGLVDHEDLDKANNRWVNLRCATRSQNGYNTGLSSRNRSGIKGVHWDLRCGKWRVQVRALGKLHHVGLFTALDEAAEAYRLKAQELHGQFARAA